MADASWLPDPSGAHQLRYWDGAAWTEHVSDNGVTGQEPLTQPFPPPVSSAPPPPPAAPGFDGPPAAAGHKVSWKDRLKQVADQGKQLADQGKQKLAEQSAKRTEQWANDPNTLWFGESKGAATSAMGAAKARYRITRDRVWIESGLLGTKTESVPMWSIMDIDVRQAVWQQGKDVGDVVLTLEDAAYASHEAGMFSMTGMPEQVAHGTGRGQVVLDNIEHPYQVVDILTPLISEARTKKTIERQSQYVHMQNPVGGVYGAAPASPPAPVPREPQEDLADQLRKLATLRDEGVLTDDEFAAQKAKLLG